MKLAFFDFETTDNKTDVARVTELAVGIYDSETQKLLRSYTNTLYSEEYPPMAEGAAAVTGLSDDYLKRVGELPYEAFIILTHYFNQADRIVGHNIKRFDIPIYVEEMKRMHLPTEKIENLIDTRYDLEFPAHITTRKLSYLAVEHGIPVTNAHSAIYDVMTNAALFFKYDLARTLELAASPEIWVRADVKFDDKQKAKDKKYMWDGQAKIWAKNIKEILYDDEIKNSDFKILKLESNYQYPET